MTPKGVKKNNKNKLRKNAYFETTPINKRQK